MRHELIVRLPEVSKRSVLVFVATFLVAVHFVSMYMQPKSVEAIVANSMDSVVLIECKVKTPSTTRSVYTAGFISSEYGHILTVAHGLPACLNQNEKNIRIWLGSDSKEFHRAKILRYNAAHDVALLQMPSMPKLRVLPLATKPSPVGSRVVAIGHPELLYWSACTGTLNYDRMWSKTPRRIVTQITAPINQGNSGGPVFDEDGKVIGIVSFTLQSANSLGFIITYETLDAMLRGTYH